MRYIMWIVLAFGIITSPTVFGQDGADAEFDEFDEFSEFDDATVQEGQVSTINDPIRGFNVVMYHFNDKLYFWVLQPSAKVWATVLPEPARNGVSNFFHNVRMPIRLVNSVAQLKWGKAGNELRRFGVNTTLGFLGLEDAAFKLYGWEKSDEDLGQTLGHYGIGPGFYIMLPFLGPSSLRDGVGTIGDSFLDPVTYATSGSHQLVRPAIKAGEAVNAVSLNPDAYPDLKKQAVDPYTFIRDIYHQNREKKVAE